MNKQKLIYPGEYCSWSSMVTRCTNRNRADWKNYGGRGISVCEEWRRFANFLADMGCRPNGFTLERVDVSGNYEPGNCRWIPKGEQSRNARSNHRVMIGGETRLLSEWAVVAGTDPGTLKYRIDQGWPESELLSKPDMARSKHATRKTARLRLAQAALTSPEKLRWEE